MHKFTQNVVETAKHFFKVGTSIEAVTWGAANVLMKFSTLRVGWWPNPAVVPAETIEKWLQSGQRKTEGVVEQSWKAKRNGSNIFELAALYSHIDGLLDINDGLDWPGLLTFVCDDLGTYDKWPELHDVKKFYPLPRPPIVSRVPPNTTDQVIQVNVGVYSQRNAGMANIMEQRRLADAARWRSQQDWAQQKLLQEQLRNKP